MPIYYGMLDLRTTEKANGWWIHFGTRFGDAYIYHKTPVGYVDLTFPNTAEKMDVVQSISAWLRGHRFDTVKAVRTGKAAVLRIFVPPIDITKPFEDTSENELKQCLDAVQELTDFARVVRKGLQMK